MGSAQGKNKDVLAATPTPKAKEKAPDNVSPLYAIAASLNQVPPDPRSPGYKRTPLSTPFESPCSTPPLARYRMITRLGSSSKFASSDPRSPAAKRTPLHDIIANNEARVSPPPFSLGDPRSPSIIDRTPLAASAMDAVVVTDDIVVATEEVICEVEMASATASSDSIEKGIEKTLERASIGAESVCEKVTVETFSSPEYSPSPAIMALSVSPLNSPIGSRKRKDMPNGPSPLKKSYSAPIDENGYPNPPSPVNKPLKNSTRARTPLSPLSQRTINSRHGAGVQPIKLRMDPAILG